MHIWIQFGSLNQHIHIYKYIYKIARSIYTRNVDPNHTFLLCHWLIWSIPVGCHYFRPPNRPLIYVCYFEIVSDLITKIVSDFITKIDEWLHNNRQQNSMVKIIQMLCLDVHFSCAANLCLRYLLSFVFTLKPKKKTIIKTSAITHVFSYSDIRDVDVYPIYLSKLFGWLVVC